MPGWARRRLGAGAQEARHRGAGGYAGIGCRRRLDIGNINAAGCVGTSLIAAPPGSIVEPESTAQPSRPAGRGYRLRRVAAANYLAPRQIDSPVVGTSGSIA